MTVTGNDVVEVYIVVSPPDSELEVGEFELEAEFELVWETVDEDGDEVEVCWLADETPDTVLASDRLETIVNDRASLSGRAER